MQVSKGWKEGTATERKLGREGRMFLWGPIEFMITKRIKPEGSRV